MPKAGAPPKVTAIRSAPVTSAVKFKTINRSRNKAGRATVRNVKTTLAFLPPEPTPPPPSDLHHGELESDDEEVIQLTTQKGPSRAVSVSARTSHSVNFH